MVFEEIEEGKKNMAAALRTEELAACKCEDLNSYGHGQQNELLEVKDGGHGYRRGRSPGFS
jgi:hypothetical protein